MITQRPEVYAPVIEQMFEAELHKLDLFLDNVQHIVDFANKTSRNQREFMRYCSSKLRITDPEKFKRIYWRE